MLQSSHPTKKSRQPCPWDRCAKPREEVERLCRDNQGLVMDAVVKVAIKFPRVDRQLLVSAGQQVLWRCAVGFRKELGWKFATFAHRSIYRELFRVCKNQPRTRPKRLHLRHDSPGGQTPLERLIEEETEARKFKVLRRAVSQLPEKERAIIRAHFFEDETFQSVAKRRRIGRKRIYQIRDRALQRLKRRLIDKMELINQP